MKFRKNKACADEIIKQKKKSRTVQQVDDPDQYRVKVELNLG